MVFWLTSTQPAALTSGLDLISSCGLCGGETCSRSNGTLSRSPLRVSPTIFEGRSLRLPVNRNQVLLVMHADAIAGGDLDQRAGEIGHAEDGRRVGEEIKLAVVQDAAAAQPVGDQIDDLLRRAGAFERHRRLRAHDLVAGLEFLHAFPGVARRGGRIIAAHAVAAERVARGRRSCPSRVSRLCKPRGNRK